MNLSTVLLELLRIGQFLLGTPGGRGTTITFVGPPVEDAGPELWQVVAAPVVALLVGGLAWWNGNRGLAQQRAALEHDRAMRLQEAQLGAIANMIRVMATADGANERFRAELHAGYGTLAHAWLFVEPIFAGAHAVAGAYSELGMYLPPETELSGLAESALTAEQELVVNLKSVDPEAADSGKKAFLVVQHDGEWMQSSMLEFVRVARRFAAGEPLKSIDDYPGAA